MAARNDRRRPQRDRDHTRINAQIRVPQVRLIGADGEQIGVMDTAAALEYAQQRDLDLVEVAAQARPPVCRAMNYSKFRYEQQRKRKAAKRNQKVIHTREVKLRVKIADHDFATKAAHAHRFLARGDKVKATIMFRGREVSHPELGEALLERLADTVSDVGSVESAPARAGRDMHMLLAPAGDA